MTFNLFNTDAGPCTNAICRIYNFCCYNNRWDECFCNTPWTGANCSNYSRYQIYQLNIPLDSTDLIVILSIICNDFQ